MVSIPDATTGCIVQSMVGKTHEKALLLGEDLATFSARYQEWLKEELKPRDMNHVKRKILRTLKLNGPQRMSDLASVFDLDPKRMTEKVDVVEREGLVRRVPHAEDRRSKVVELTDLGRSLLDETEPLFEKAGMRLLDSFDEGQLDELHSLVEHLTNRLSQLRHPD